MTNQEATVLTDEEFEAVALAHYLRRIPDLDEVSVSVRQGGAVVRYVLIRPGKPTEVVTSRLS